MKETLDCNGTGERIKKIRKDMGIKQCDLAMMLGVSANYLCLLEKGKKNASLNLIRKISQLSGKSIDEIVYGPTEKSNMNN